MSAVSLRVVLDVADGLTLGEVEEFTDKVRDLYVALVGSLTEDLYINFNEGDYTLEVTFNG